MTYQYFTFNKQKLIMTRHNKKKPMKAVRKFFGRMLCGAKANKDEIVEEGKKNCRIRTSML